MRPPHRVKKPKPKADLQNLSGDESVDTHSSGLSDDDLDALLQFSKNIKTSNNSKNGTKSSNPASISVLAQANAQTPAKSVPQDLMITKRGQNTCQNSQDSGMQFILAGHANLHKAANNAAQMSMHIHQQFKNFKLNDNGQVVKSSKVGKGTKRKGKPATVEEWNDHRKFGPPSTPVDNNRSHTGRGQFYLRDEFCKDSDFNNASSEMDTISSEDDISTDSEELDQYEKNLQNLLTTVRAATGGGRRGALVLMKFLILLLKQPKG